MLTAVAVRKYIRPLVSAVWLAAAVVPLAVPARAQSLNLQKVSPALVTQMTASPLALIPVIIEMAAASPPFAPGTNLALAQQAVTILNANGQTVGGQRLDLATGPAHLAVPARGPCDTGMAAGRVWPGRHRGGAGLRDRRQSRPWQPDPSRGWLCRPVRPAAPGPRRARHAHRRDHRRRRHELGRAVR